MGNGKKRKGVCVKEDGVGCVWWVGTRSGCGVCVKAGGGEKGESEKSFGKRHLPPLPSPCKKEPWSGLSTWWVGGGGVEKGSKVAKSQGQRKKREGVGEERELG